MEWFTPHPNSILLWATDGFTWWWLFAVFKHRWVLWVLWPAVTPRAEGVMLTGHPSSSACQPIWRDSAWTILGMGGWLSSCVLSQIMLPDISQAGFYPSSCFSFSSHHLKMRISTFQAKEQSRQRPTSHCVQIQLSPGWTMFLFQCRQNDFTKGNTSQRGAADFMKTEFSMHSSHCREHQCPIVRCICSAFSVIRGWIIPLAHGERYVGRANLALYGVPRHNTLNRGIKHLVKIV